jgi:hypothetical protein
MSTGKPEPQEDDVQELRSAASVGPTAQAVLVPFTVASALRVTITVVVGFALGFGLPLSGLLNASGEKCYALSWSLKS